MEDYYVVLSEKTQKSQVPILYDFCIRFGMHFGIVSGTFGYDFRYFSSLIFACFFVNIFGGARHQHGSQLAPQMDQEFQKKTKFMLATSIWEYSTPIRLRFGSTLVAIWDVLGISWQPFGITFGNVWPLSGIFWSSSKDRLARCQVCSNTLNCPFCD